MSQMQMILQKFEDFDVRIVDQHGDPWWIAKDACDVLGLTVRDSVRYIDDDDKSYVSREHIGLKPGRPITIINEPGLYTLILRSRKPNAKRFKRWVTHEVIPSIRKTGKYDATKAKRGRPKKQKALEDQHWAERLEISPEEAAEIKRINTAWRKTVKHAGVGIVPLAQTKLYDHAFGEKGFRKDKKKSFHKPMNLEQIRFVADIERDSSILINRIEPTLKGEDDVMDTIYDVTDSKKAFIAGDSKAYLEKAFDIAERMEAAKLLEDQRGETVIEHINRLGYFPTRRKERVTA